MSSTDRSDTTHKEHTMPRLDPIQNERASEQSRELLEIVKSKGRLWMAVQKAKIQSFTL